MGGGGGWTPVFSYSAFVHEGLFLLTLYILVTAGSLSRGGDVAIYVFDETKRACPLLFILFL